MISLEKSLWKQINQAAQDMCISQNLLVELAIEAYLQRPLNARLVEAINRIYKENPVSEEELTQQEAMRRHCLQLVEKEDW